MVVISAAAVLLLQVAFFCSICARIFFVCNENVCFGRFYFLKIWLFLPLYCRIFKTVCGKSEAVQIWSSCNYATEFVCEGQS